MGDGFAPCQPHLEDVATNTNQIIFSTCLKKFDFLVGRFAGATLVAVLHVEMDKAPAALRALESPVQLRDAPWVKLRSVVSPRP